MMCKNAEGLTLDGFAASWPVYIRLAMVVACMVGGSWPLSFCACLPLSGYHCFVWFAKDGPDRYFWDDLVAGAKAALDWAANLTALLTPLSSSS
jgi:hypothetical protein